MASPASGLPCACTGPPQITKQGPDPDFPAGLRPCLLSLPLPPLAPNIRLFAILGNLWRQQRQKGLEPSPPNKADRVPGRAAMMVGPGGEERGLKTERLIVCGGKEGHGPCPVTMTVPSHGTRGRDTRPLRTAETQMGRGCPHTTLRSTRKGEAVQFLRRSGLGYGGAAAEERWGRWQRQPPPPHPRHPFQGGFRFQLAFAKVEE